MSTLRPTPASIISTCSPLSSLCASHRWQRHQVHLARTTLTLNSHSPPLPFPPFPPSPPPSPAPPSPPPFVTTTLATTLATALTTALTAHAAAVTAATLAASVAATLAATLATSSPHPRHHPHHRHPRSAVAAVRMLTAGTTGFCCRVRRAMCAVSCAPCRVWYPRAAGLGRAASVAARHERHRLSRCLVQWD